MHQFFSTLHVDDNNWPNYSHFLFSLFVESDNVAILDMQTNEHVHRFAVATNQQITDVACHPTLPMFATVSDSSVCLWNGSTYRLEKMVNFTDHPIRRGMVLAGTKNITRYYSCYLHYNDFTDNLFPYDSASYANNGRMLIKLYNSG